MIWVIPGAKIGKMDEKSKCPVPSYPLVNISKPLFLTSSSKWLTYCYSESLQANNIGDKDYFLILFLLNQKFLIPYISIYVEERKKGYTTCLGQVRVILGHKHGETKKKERPYPDPSSQSLLVIPHPGIHTLQFPVHYPSFPILLSVAWL